MRGWIFQDPNPIPWHLNPACPQEIGPSSKFITRYSQKGGGSCGLFS